MRVEHGTIRVWFDLARAGNFPSVASNILAALILSSPTLALGWMWPAGSVLVLCVLAGCLLYAGGATFNDVADAEFDSRHRPDRAIPRQAVTRAAAAWVAAIQMAAGFAILV